MRHAYKIYVLYFIEAASMRIIAICGARRSGKDYIANIFSRNEYKHVKFSAKLKDMCRVLFDFTPDQLETDSKEAIDPRWGVSPRQMMQFLGTEVMQYALPQTFPQMDLGREFWVRSTLASMEAHKKYVISDLRFLHEERILRTYPDVCIIKVQRQRSDAEILTHIDSHPSEQEFYSIREDITINNNGTLEDLEKYVVSLMQKD
jgi:hypothetical protein